MIQNIKTNMTNMYEISCQQNVASVIKMELSLTRYANFIRL